MKKIYLFAASLLLGASSFAQNGTIQNGGFENWTDQTIYEYPTQWQSSNQEWGGIETVFKSTDAQAGTYSCQIGAELVGQDTVFGYIFHGTAGQMGPDGGIPYTANFDEIRFQYKSDIASVDTFFVIAIRYQGGVMVGNVMLEQAAVGTQSTWTQGSVMVPAGTQDELFIGFIMGNPFGGISPMPDSWARIDAVQMYNAGNAVTNIPNPGFEDWTTVSYEVADNWYSTSEILAGSGLENAIKTIDANSGTYAIEMTTVQDSNSGDTIASFLSNGAINFNAQGSPWSAIPYNATPTTFSGAYKYTPSNGDQAAIQIEFFAAGVPVGNHVEFFGSSSTWQTFAAPLTITSQPDSMIFFAYSGGNPGSVLKLDDLAFSGGDVGINEFASMNVSIYPNPATSSVMLKAEGTYAYTIIDVAGNIVMTRSNINGAIQLDINDLARGAYVVKIANDNTIETHKLIVE